MHAQAPTPSLEEEAIKSEGKGLVTFALSSGQKNNNVQCEHVNKSWWMVGMERKKERVHRPASCYLPLTSLGQFACWSVGRPAGQGLVFQEGGGGEM